jgi:glycosyltransferase involved in cell wall biosynthesis
VIDPPEDVRAVADAIASLLADPERAKALGRAARRRVEAELTYDALAARLGDALDVHGAAP